MARALREDSISATSSAATAGRWILLPGTLCTAAVFAPVLDSLGVSNSDRVEMRLASANLADFGARLRDVVSHGDIVCGFSLGSLVLANNLPALGKARAIVLLSLNPLADAAGNATLRRAVRDRVLSGDISGWVDDNWHNMSVGANPVIRDTVVSMATETRPLIAPQIELAITRPDSTRALAGTNLPLVFVTGAEDRMTPPEPIIRVAGTARCAAVHILPGLGHFGLLEDPERVATAIRAGLQDVLARHRIAGDDTDR